MSSVRDPGLQPERTALAWQRTALGGVGCLLVTVRLLAEVSPSAAAVVGGAAVLALVTPIWLAARWRAGMRARGRSEPDGRMQLVLASLIAVACLVGLVYAVLG